MCKRQTDRETDRETDRQTEIDRQRERPFLGTCSVLLLYLVRLLVFGSFNTVQSSWYTHKTKG